MIVYITNEPSNVIIKHKNLDKMRPDEINYIETEESCPNEDIDL